jgi:hypothetical protein
MSGDERGVAEERQSEGLRPACLTQVRICEPGAPLRSSGNLSVRIPAKLVKKGIEWNICVRMAQVDSISPPYIVRRLRIRKLSGLGLDREALYILHGCQRSEGLELLLVR